jgi:riboflavin kinase/FMN adenylyltransferase
VERPSHKRFGRFPAFGENFVPIIRDLSELPDNARGGAVAIGNFDGVHLGHLRIVERLLERAQAVSGPAIVFTFDPHPVRILRPDECPPPLTWTERKAQLLAKHGVYKIVAYPTDEALLSLSAQEFFDKIVLEALGARAIVEGPNFYFGHNREGNVEVLGQLAAAAGISLDVVTPFEQDGTLVSSSLVRRLVSAGEVTRAAELLSAPYRIRGMVTHGAGRGAKLGFPTANLEAVDTLLPATGVYAGRAWLGDVCYPAAINLGPNPTFGEGAAKVEVHLIDHQETIYGQPLEVEFLERLRDVIAFDSEAQLIKQLEQDVARSRTIAAQF